MEEILIIVGVIAFPVILISIILNNFRYLKNVRELLKYLQQNHYEKIKDWGLPDSLMDASPKRVPKLLKFLKSPEYFDDLELKNLKDQTAKRLKLSYILFGGGVIFLIMLYVLIGCFSL